MKIEKIISDIRRDSELKSGDKIVICLNKACASMLEDAFLLPAQGSLQRIWGTCSSDADLADEAVVRLTADGDDLVAFHETRTNSFNHRPNGILVSVREFPCVVFCNTGSERLTVGMERGQNDSEWVSPGDYTFSQDADRNRPEVQKALEEFVNSPKVLDAVRLAQEQYEEKKRGQAGR